MSSTAASMLSSKTCVVTGATSGIGEATAQGLAALGATVVVHGRDASRGRHTLERIERATGSRSVRFLQADLASLAQVRRLAGEIRSSLPRLDILVHNAGLACAHRSLTTDGYERTFAVNHLAPFLLTQLLAAPLAQSPAGRIVVVSSEAHRGAQLDFEDLMLARRYGQMRAYARSKLANLLFTRALARRLTGTAVTCNALHPGVVRTGIFREAPAFLRGILGSIGRVLLLPPEKGARTSLYLATSDEAAGRSGGYYISCKRTQPSEAALDDAAAERLWEVSEQLAGAMAVQAALRP